MKKTFTLAKSIKLLLIVLFTSALMINSERSNAQYTVGDLIVTDAVSASLNNTTLNLIDIQTSGAAQSAGFTVSTPATTFRASGSSGSNGYAALSNNGTLYNVTGANSNNTSTSMKSLTPKAVGSVNNTGTFSISTTYTNNTGNSLPIGATSLDNTNWFISDQGGIYTNNANSTTGSPAVTTLGSIRAFGGTVYTCNTASGPAVGIISAVTGGTFTGLTGVGTNSKVVDFYLISSGTNGTNYDILYVLSQSSATAGIIAKYSLVAGSWIANSTYTTAFGGIGMAAKAGSGSASLYVTTGKGGTTVANNLIKLTDAAGYNANISITTANNVTLFTAPAADELKGVDFAPVTGNITLSPVTLTPFTYTEGSGPATAQSFTVSATNLTSGGGTITIAGSPDYEVSTTSATTGFAGANGSVTLTYTGTGTISPNTVWVRMIAGLTNAASPYNNETITISGGGGINSMAASGTVTASVPTIAVTPTTLTGLVSTIGSTTQYLEQTYSVSGINMGANDIYITPPTGVEIGLTSGGESSSVISLTPTSGSVSNTTIYVRIANTASAGTFAAVSIRDSALGGTTKLVAVSGKVLAAPVAFSSGNIVVNRSGAGFTALSSGSTPEFVDEYTTSGTLVQSIMMPTAVSGSNRRLVESGSASSNGIPTLSVDGQYLIVTGYDTTVGIASVNGLANTTNGGTTDRIVARIDYNGNINTTTRVSDGYSGNNIRSAASIDGTSFWASGAGTIADGGARYITLGSRSSTQLSAAPANADGINIFGNQLWGSAQKSPNTGISTIGSSIPVTTGQTTNLVVNVADKDVYAFVILDNNSSTPGVNVMYVADQTSGLLKYGLVSGVWTAEGNVTGVVSGVTGKVVGTSVVLYVTVGNPGNSGNTIYTITDNAAYNAVITGNGTAITTGGTLVATAGTNTTFRGVTFAPLALPGTPAVAVSSPGPALGNITEGTSNNVLYRLNLAASTANAIVTNLRFTTGGGYTTSDFVANSFKLWYSTNSAFDATATQVGASAIVSSGGSMTFNLAQTISSGSTGYFYLTGDVIGSATAGHNINITALTLPANVALADGATQSGAATAGGVQTIISGSVPTVFYSNGGDLSNLANWGDNTNGTIAVSGPANFTTDGYIFNVANGSTTIGANWIVSGTNAKVVVLTGQSFTVPAAFSFTGTIDVNATGTLTLLNATVPTFGTLDPAGTVIFGSTSVAQTVPGGTYGNLTLTGLGNKVIGGVYNSAPINVMGNLIFDHVSLDRTLGTLQTIGFYGNVTVQNGAVYTANYNITVNLEAKGTANQVVASNGYSLQANIFYLDADNNGNPSNLKPSGSVSLSTANGGTNLILGGDLRLDAGNSSPANTATFVDNGNNISVAGNVEIDGSSANYTLTGTITLNGVSGTQTICQNHAGGATAALKANLHNLSIQTTGSATVQVEPSTGSATININGNLNLSSTSSNKFMPNGNTINIAGNFTDTKNADEIAAGASTFVFDGTSLQTISTVYTTGESFFNVEINNAASVQLAGTSGAIKITSTGNLNMIAGTLVTNAGKVILNNTATITESTTSYVIGTVTSTRTLSSSTNETFGGMGIEVDALGTAPGSTVATRVTGISSPLGCASSSILRKFTLAPATNTGLNATVVFHYLASSYELNGFSGSNLSLFESTNGGSSWNSLISTDNSGASTVTSTGLATLGLIAASTPVPVGGIVTPINSIVCPSGSATLTANGATGTLQWQSSTDNVNWSDISGETNATYSAAPSVKTYYRATATFPGCLIVSSTTGIVEVSSSTITVTSTNVTGNSVTLNWSPVGTGNYAINFSGASSGTLTSVTPPKTVTGLTSGGTYDFTISQTGASLTGCPASGSLTNVATLCGAPANVTATSPAANQLQVSWTGTPGTNYRVFYRPLFAYNTYFTKDVVNASSVVITKQGNNNIYASNTYEVYVTTLDCPTTGAVGAPSNFVYVTTLPSVACATPVIDSVRSICPVQIEVFIHPNPDITNYTVYLQRETPTVLAVNSYGIASNYFTINTPYSGDQYLIAVEAKCSSNSASAIAIWPGNVTIKPLCDGPANLILSNPTCHGFTASWNADECVSNSASGYDLYLRVAGTINYNSYGVGLPANGLSPSDVLNFLTTGRTYQVFVRSIYSCNGFVTYGPVSQTLSINTLSSGCRDEEDAPVTEQQAPAVQQTAPDNSEVMTLYPNPNNGQFEVALSSLNTDDREVRVEVMNMLGQTVVTHFSTIGGGQYNEQIKLPSVAAGTYIVRVTVGKNTYTSKINVSK